MDSRFYATSVRPALVHVGPVWSVWLGWLRYDRQGWAPGRKVWLLKDRMQGTDAILLAERINRDEDITDERVRQRMLAAFLEVEL